MVLWAAMSPGEDNLSETSLHLLHVDGVTCDLSVKNADAVTCG